MSHAPAQRQSEIRHGAIEDLARAVAAQIEALGARQRAIVIVPEAPTNRVGARMWRMLLWMNDSLPVPRRVARRFEVTDAQRERAVARLVIR
jgi:hypothetical protein